MSLYAKIGVFSIGMGVTAFSLAADFSFDRPGEGFGTSITPVGHVAWEQGLPSASYIKSSDGMTQTETTALSADMLLRTGLTDSLELQLGWQGPSWAKSKSNGRHFEDDGLGDISVGLKKAIDLNDENLSMAILAEAVIATGNDGFSNDEDIYSLSSSVAYDYNELLTTSITMRYAVEDSDWSVTAIPTVEYQIADKWSGFSELVYRKAESEKVEYALGTGILYRVNDRMQLDASVGVDLNGRDKSYQSGLGFAVLF